MPTKITMPRLGESVSEGTVGRWLKQVGETVKKDEALVEIMTDKVTAEYPSPVAGKVVRILVAEDATVPVGTEIAEIEEVGGSGASGSAASTGAGATPMASGSAPSGAGAAAAMSTPPTATVPSSNGGMPSASYNGGSRAGMAHGPQATATLAHPDRAGSSNRACLAAGAPPRPGARHRLASGAGHRREQPHPQGGHPGIPRAAHTTPGAAGGHRGRSNAFRSRRRAARSRAANRDYSAAAGRRPTSHVFRRGRVGDAIARAPRHRRAHGAQSGDLAARLDGGRGGYDPGRALARRPQRRLQGA